MTPTQALLRHFEFAPEPTPVALLPNPNPGASMARVDKHVDGLQVRQGFRIGHLNLMIRYADGSELTEIPQVYRLPNAPHWVRGMVNLHGALIPVFDLASWFGSERAAALKPMLLVLGHGNDAAGVVIDGLPERMRWNSEQLADPGLVPEALTEVAPSAVLIGEQLWFDLDCTALLQSLELALAVQH
jgi:chemotaxis signal transduction protein